MNNAQKRREKAALIREMRAENIKRSNIKRIAGHVHGEPPREVLADYWPIYRCSLGGIYACTSDKYGESWVRRWLLPGDVDDETISRELGIGEYYRGPGQSFGSYPDVERNGRSTLITQSCGLDI